MVFAAIVVIVFFVLRSLLRAGGSRGVIALETNGLRARGLVLQCSQYSTGVTLGGRRFEKRTMTIDIEVPGRAPYVAQGDFLVPRGVVETVPGASLDLSVDPKNQNQFAVLGPGGFSGPWIRQGPPPSY